MNKIDVYLEIGKKRTFAGALEWPGWCRSGRDENAAVQALIEYGPRYERVLRHAGIEFQGPYESSAITVVERLEGNATTDFSAPDAVPSLDLRPIDHDELQRFQTLLSACWQAFDRGVKQAYGKELRKGPRGGGRDLEEISQHVLGSARSYLARLAWKPKSGEAQDLSEGILQTREDVSEALAAAALGELPARGPRGGTIWAPRYFVRRMAWHILDHLWEIEARAGQSR
ncbi:MAG: hypothetical protein M1281_17155 [Chloroflexi bacterium]|nr:hypothetical protein [Chloroflexota bacterium]